MDFYSASRDKVFIAVASYNIKGSMALGLSTGTPVRVRLPGFTSLIDQNHLGFVSDTLYAPLEMHLVLPLSGVFNHLFDPSHPGNHLLSQVPTDFP